ncbi:hypothetical protein, partial [Pseudomonas protegens]
TSTFSTSLTLKGTASKGQDVEAFDGSGSGAVSKGKAKADQTTGLWECTIEVVVGARRLYVKALYPVSPVYSNVRTLTVERSSAPTLSSVKGSPSGNEITENGFTVETTVVLSGVAAAGREIEVLDDAVSKGKTTSNGTWTVTVSNLSKAKHSFTARDVEQPSLVSAARTLTVTEEIAATLTSVKGSPSDVEIPENGFTAETAFTVSGVAANGQKVEIFDNDASKGQAQADASGKWQRIITGLSTTAPHSIYAKGLYGPGASTERRGFTVLPVYFTEGFENYPQQIVSSVETTYMRIASTQITDGYVRIIATPPALYLVSRHAVTSSATLSLRVPCYRVEFAYSIYSVSSPNGVFIATFFGSGPTPLKTLRLPANQHTGDLSAIVEEPGIRRIELSNTGSGIADSTAIFITVDNFKFTAQT